MTMHTFSVYVEDRPGVLNRVASLFRRRGFNIVSLAVGHSETAGVSRMTLVVQTDAGGAQRIAAHLYKLIDVIRVQDITNSPAVIRDLALIKVSADREHRPSLMQLAEVFGARVVDVSPQSIVIEMVGSEAKIDGLLDVLQPYGVLEMVRTGRVAMSRGVGSGSAQPGQGPAAAIPDSETGVSYSV
jgi:acetolactate synthase I/III small subunit